MTCILAYIAGLATLIVPAIGFLAWAIRTAEDAPFLPDNRRETR